ncbi:MAG: DUF1631 family protein [Parahaliea sp.]
MSVTDHQNKTYNAVLELPDALRLFGSLKSGTDGEILLHNTQIVGGKDDVHLSLQQGMTGQLAFANAPLTTAQVILSGIDGNNLRLAFNEPNSEAATGITLLLSGAARLSDTSTNNTIQTMTDRDSNTIKTPPLSPSVPAAYRELVHDFEQRCLTQIAERFDGFITGLITELSDLSNPSEYEGVKADDIYLSLNGLKVAHSGMARGFVEQVSERFQDLAPEQRADYPWEIASGNSASSLNLVGINEFESALAVDRMVKIGKEIHGVVLECLTVRLATMVEVEPQKLRLPVHVTEFCAILQQLLQNCDVHERVIPHIFKFYVRKFITPLNSYYQPLNMMLVDAGLCPDLEQQIQSRGSVLAPRSAVRRPSSSHGGTETNLDEQAAAISDESTANSPPVSPIQGSGHLFSPGSVSGHAGNPAADTDKPSLPQTDNTLSHSLSPERLYKSVVDALNFQREFATMIPGPGGMPMPAPGTDHKATPSGPLADSAMMVNALATLQHNQDVRSQLTKAGSLRNYLDNHSNSIAGLEGIVGLEPNSLNQLDLVDSLFSTIGSQLDINKQMEPVLAELRIPLAKLALLEPGFFLDQEHAARGVIDKLSQLTVAANFPNKILENRLSEIIDNIVQRYDRDSTVFESALGQIDKLVAQQESAHARNVDRVIKTQEGQERLRQARSDVNAAIRERLRDIKVPAILLQLINKGWRDLLVLNLVKEGADSDSWKEHLRTLDILIEWLLEQQQGLDGETMVQRGLEADPFIDMLQEQATSELPANIELNTILGELRNILAGDTPVETTELGKEEFAAEQTHKELHQRLSKTQRLRRWVKRVETLETGTWLSYRNREGEKRRMQLAWISSERDRYVFVNERGQKIADMNSVQLAHQLSRGAKPPAPTEKLSLVDQSMYRTLEGVQETLNFSQNHDQLTGLINLAAFTRQVEFALQHANKKATSHAVLHLNIDQFKLVNELYDRVAGDQVLGDFARNLAQRNSSSIFTARLDEDNFGILLAHHNFDQATAIAEDIRSQIESDSIDIDGDPVRLTVSIGVAPIYEYSPDVDTVMEHAGKAMHRAKNEGRNRVVRYKESSEDQKEQREKHNNSRKDLEQALATDRFVLRAQPIVQSRIDDDRPPVLHYELLLGLRDDNGRIVSPEKFIASAERHGFMIAVDRWVVREAFQWISSLMDAQKIIPSIAINLSGTSITDDAFMEYLFEQISEFGVGTNRLCFEITETGNIANLVKAADFVRAFRNIGCKFSLDDFGTGLASHAYLRELPVDYVKIDGTFITGIDENRNDFTMARSINDLAHFLGQETIAESVENERIIARLKQIGVDYLQGWGIGMPRLLTEITKELSTIEK